ncbi:MAG: hypothetical protein ACOCQX_03885 [Candidatus Nanoarchaeia archaeon]
MAKKRVQYINIPLEDVEGLLPFNKKGADDLTDEITEEERIKRQIAKFMQIIEKRMNEKVSYMGTEKQYGIYMERFMFSKGFVEIIVEKPLLINAHFSDMNEARKYAQALKAAVQKTLPESETKKMLINSISIKPRQKKITMGEWEKIHRIYIRKSLIFTLAAVFIVAMFEVIKAGFELVFLDWLEIGNDKTFVIIGAVIVAFLFEPIKKKTESFINKHFIR